MAKLDQTATFCDQLEKLTKGNVRHSSFITGIGRADNSFSTDSATTSPASSHQQEASSSAAVGNVKGSSKSLKQAKTVCKGKSKKLKSSPKNNGAVDPEPNQDPVIQEQLGNHLIGQFDVLHLNCNCGWPWILENQPLCQAQNPVLLITLLL